MATAPPVPNFAQYNFELGDTSAAITKQNGQNAALVSYGQAMAAFGSAIEQEQADTLAAAEVIQTATQDVLDDFLRNYLGPRSTPPTTDPDGDPLVIGALYLSTAAGDEGMRYWDGAAWVEAYATIDGLTWADITGKPASYPPSTHGHAMGEVTGLQGALAAKRDQTDTSFTRYDLTAVATTATLNLNAGNVFTVNASTARTLSFSNVPTGRAMTVIVTLSGNAAITWPTGINGAAPDLFTTQTVVTIFYDGSTWIFAGAVGY